MSRHDANRNRELKNRSKRGSGNISWLPDIPVLRSVTKRELQLFTIGIWPGVAIALALANQKFGAAAGIAGMVYHRLKQDSDKQDASGMAGYIRDASSLVAGALAGLAVMLVLVTVFGVELTIPDLGVVA